MATTITDAQCRQYREEGYFILEKAVPEDHLQILRDACEHLMRLADEELVAAQAELTVLDVDGTAHRGAAALRRLTEVLPGVRRLSWAYRLPGVTAAVGALYRGVQRRRVRKPCLNCGQTWMSSKKASRSWTLSGNTTAATGPGPNTPGVPTTISNTAG